MRENLAATEPAGVYYGHPACQMKIPAVQSKGMLAVHLTVFASGASVLVLEILGTRLLSPYFGSNLYVWSALISITLFALALGYWVGGHVADARGSAALLDLILATAAVLVAVVPLLVRSTIRSFLEIRFEAAILTSAILYFGPALFLLAMVGPVAIRLAAPDFNHVGRSAGSIYAFSTAGSIAGALAAGFVFLPRFSANYICYSNAALLLALAAARWLARRNSGPAGALAGSLVFVLGSLLLLRTAPQGSRSERGFRVVYDRPSFYGPIRVVEDQRARYLLIDGSLQTMQTLDGYPLFPYIWTLGLLPYLRLGGKEMLLIGLGGGDMVRLGNRFGIRTVAVEIDAAVAETAVRHFGLHRDEFLLVIDDGRRYLGRPEQNFDFIALDAYAGSCPPIHLFSREAFTSMRRRLRPEGVLAINVVVQSQRDPLIGEVAATLSRLFSYVGAFRTGKDSDSLGNVVFFASDGPLALPQQWIPAPPYHPHARFLDALREQAVDSRFLHGQVIEDDRNPVDLRSAATDLKSRATYRSYFPWSVLHY